MIVFVVLVVVVVVGLVTATGYGDGTAVGCPVPPRLAGHLSR